jgi:hypothetical protein
MAKSKKKDDFEAVIEDLKVKVSDMLKTCKKNVKKMDELDCALYGISDKEIKEVAKAMKGRKPDAATIAKSEMYKVDPA